jgi:hypothetical protein
MLESGCFSLCSRQRIDSRFSENGSFVLNGLLVLVGAGREVLLDQLRGKTGTFQRHVTNATM